MKKCEPTINSKILSLNCEPKEEHIPKSQKIGIKLMKYIPKSILNKVTESCERWKKGGDVKEFIKDYKIDWKNAKKCKDDKTLKQCVEKFTSKNEFFQREISDIIIQDSYLVSPAECRLTYYNTITESKELWIKGKNFTIKNLLNNESIYDKFLNGSIMICRLAPDDYHRFHFPVDCVYMGGYKLNGEYYSVNPIIVNSSVDVYTENKREIHSLYNSYFGNIAFIIIGATCVGSIEVENLKEGKFYTKGKLFGKFGFGGSTIVMLFEKQIKNINSIILNNSLNKKETYVKVGNNLLF